MFDKTRKFVEDTRFLTTIILKRMFYDDKVIHRQVMERYSGYWRVNVNDLPNEVNSSPIQTCFDDYKRLLNSVDLPDIDTWGMGRYIREHLSTDPQLVDDAVSIFEGCVEQCGLLRNVVTNLMKTYGLVDNHPMQGFLQPLYVERTDKKKVVENERLPSTEENTDSPGTWELSTDGTRFSLRNLDYRRVFNLLTDGELGIMSSEITFEYFVGTVQRAQWGKIYKHSGTKKAKCRMVVTKLAAHTTSEALRKDYMTKAAEDMELEKRDVGKYNVLKSDTFREKLEKIL